MIIFSGEKEKRFLLWILFPVAIILLFVCNYAESTFDSGDGLSHYFISRYSWKHPDLLLDHWGKPFFTLLSSPFSQFGLLGMNVFQILCAITTSYFCFRIAQKLQLKFGWLLPVFICFSPIYFAVVNSGLTEIFFGCLLMFSIWMIFEKKFSIAALAASFLPFVRVDAYITIPLIVLVLLVRKQFKALAFLGIGFIVYSFVGYLYYGDPFWVLHKSQSFFDEGYEGMKGAFFHYPKHYESILGKSLTILLITGLAWLLYSLSLSFFRKSKKEYFTEEVLLIYGSFFACLLIHTLSYCLPGVLNNLGMMRYMVTLIPCASLIALRGLNIIIYPLNKFYPAQVIIAVLFTIYVVISPFKQWYYPFKLEQESVLVKEVAEWMKKTNQNYSKICYLHPALPLFYEIDPFDEKRVNRYINIDESFPSESFPVGSILVWDAHFSANEGRLSLNRLLNKDNLQFVRAFRPSTPFEVLGGHPFEIYIFRVTGPGNTLVSKSKILKEWTFEDKTIGSDSVFITTEYAASGKNSFKLTSEKLYSPTYNALVKELREKGIKNINVNIGLYPVFEVKKNAALIISLENDSIYYYQTVGLQAINPKLNEWNNIFCNFSIPENALDNDRLKIYFYNPDEKYIYLDDLIIKSF